MKKYISAALISLAAVTSCIESPSDLAVENGGNALKVRFSTPELEVKSGSTPDFYAYVPAELAAGNVNPIGYTNIDSDGYYLYNLPEGTTEVIFSNVNNSGKVTVSGDENQNTTFATPRGEMLLHDDILYGKVTGLSDKSSTISVDVKRLTSRISNYFYLVDEDGNELPKYNVERVYIAYTNLGNSLSIDNEGQMRVQLYDNGRPDGWSSQIYTDRNIWTNSIIHTWATCMIAKIATLCRNVFMRI